MKKGFVVFVSILALSCVHLFAQPSSKSIETFVVDNFDTEQEWSWNTRASRYVADGFPKSGSFDGIPASLRVFQNEGDPDPKVLGVEIAYNRKGDNWFEIFPEKDGEPYEIPLIGTVTAVDFWVWGANYSYSLDLLIRDAEGRVHSFPATVLSFKGWKNVIVKIPTWLRQSSKLRTGPTSITFVGFRIRTDPEEYVDDFRVFFDQIKYVTNSLETIYDGWELQSSEFGGEDK